MSAILDFGLFLVGIFLGVFWFSVIGLPLAYGFPRALYWAARGRARWRGALLYLMSPLIWNVVFLLVALFLTAFVPSVPNYLYESFGFWVGSNAGVVLAAGRAIFSKSARMDIDRDFRDFMRRHLTPSGVAAIGIGDELPRNPIHRGHRRPCWACGSAVELRPVLVLDRNGTPHGPDHQFVYSHLALLECTRCLAGLLERQTHDCFPHDEPWDTFTWYAVPPGDMARLRAGVVGCPAPMSWECGCAIHTALRTACDGLPRATWQPDVFGPFSVGETYPVTVEVENGLPRLAQSGPSWGVEIGTKWTDMPTLEDSIVVAAQAYRGETDKAGRPLILHALRVMFCLDSDLERIVGVLHDVIEDGGYSLDRLRAMGYSEEVLRALDCLTKREGETYDQFVERIKTDPIARRVKIADLRDNLDVARLPKVTEEDLERLRKYEKALVQLTR